MQNIRMKMEKNSYIGLHNEMFPSKLTLLREAKLIYQSHGIRIDIIYTPDKMRRINCAFVESFNTYLASVVYVRVHISYVYVLINWKHFGHIWQH